ncbi:MAG: CRISPR-associated protein Cas4 [Epulopiscium sp.]|nr:CRISPR-associated protein Cas4 [Candidatus Epulonipiscium sp.]
MITGTIVNYFIHCKRQCWLFANRINLEDNSEDVRIGRVLHELKQEGSKHHEISLENIKIDKITSDYIVEIKKSDADLEASKYQLLFYMKILKDKGIERKGKLEVIEKNKQDHRIHIFEFTPELERELEKVIEDINLLLVQEQPPEAIMDKKCKKCAYYEYCFL